MSARGHGSLAGFVQQNVDDAGEEVGFAVLAAEMLWGGLAEVWRMGREREGWGWGWNRGGVGRGVPAAGGNMLTRLTIASWVARWVLQVLQPKIFSLVR